ncbi:TIGR00341 family protein [uncultured Psychromonas sp.]|uniref:TIGR00341 family protein n=1 Tax=uncultured Psychromonas sp. TaxID=173974 RepID=UPI002635D4AF|nr:TIGR00341 family protein [uncultured Psychromonas sp.]
MADSFLLFDIAQKDQLTDNVLAFFEETILPRAWENEPVQFNKDSRVYAYVNDQQAPDVIQAAIDGGWQLAILPHPESIYAKRGFCAQSNLKKAIQEAEKSQPAQVDIVRCNGQILLSELVFGESFNLLPSAKSLGFVERLKLGWKNLGKIRHASPKQVTFNTENESSFTTAALGVVITAHVHDSWLSKHILPNSHINDGMCHVMLIAPRSIMELLRFITISTLGRYYSLPSFLGLVKTKSLTFTNGDVLDYQIDGQEGQAESLSVQTENHVLTLLVGESLPIIDTSSAQKEQLKIKGLPSGEAVNELASKPLAFIAHAATDEFKDLYQLLRDNATTSSAFLTLMALSTLLASVGLFASSAPVIIGAMILAPLMGPIISLSMALARQDPSLLTASATTLGIGILVSLGFSSVASFIIPMEIITPEIAARLSPSLLDLGVAVISGIAGAYAHARVDAAKSLAGVAIAVALVPPLAVTGIGIGWLDSHVAWGALLLFLTNLAGIVFAAALTFLALGFAPFTRAKKGLMIAFIGVTLVSIPLVFSFLRLSEEAKIMQQLEGKRIGQVVLREVYARALDPIEISVKLVTPETLTSAKLDAIKDSIKLELQQDVIMEAQVIIRRE